MSELDNFDEEEINELAKMLDELNSDSNEDFDYNKIFETIGLDVKELEREMDEYVPQLDLVYSKSREDAVSPSYAYETDSGFDLYSTEDVWIFAQSRKLIPTGLHIDIPDGYEIQVRSKSGLALNKGLMVLNSPGTVDCFSEDMKILTLDGEKPISEIKIGDVVYSFNENSLSIEKDIISQIFDTETQEILIIETESGILEVTPNSEVYTTKGIVLAKNLTENDEIINFF
jgi:dUTP pyrophosphatase